MYLEQSKIEQLKNQVGEATFPVLLGIFLQEMQEYKDELYQADAEKIGRICHAIKGSAPSFGAKSLAQLATEMDMLFKAGRRDELQQQVSQLIDNLTNTENSVQQLL